MVGGVLKTVVFVHMTGSKTNEGTGGGLISQEVLAKSLIERGVQVFAVTNPRDNFGFKFLGENRLVAKFSISSSPLMNLFLFNGRELKDELRHVVNRLPNDALYVIVDPFPPDIYAAKFLNKLDRKVIVNMYHITPSPLFHPIKRGFIRAIAAWFISFNALIFIKTTTIPVFLNNKRIAKELGWNLSKNLMEMPLSLQEYNKDNIDISKRSVCFVGRLAKNKGILDLIRSWRIIVRQFPDAILYIIGSDRGNGIYQKKINKYGLQGSIKITGFLDEEQKRKIMKRCSIFAFPSYEEGWALAVMEAIDMGLLPVIYDLPAYDYICNERVKTKVGDINKFADTVMYFLSHCDERSFIVKKIQGCISKFTPEFVTQIWITQVQEFFASF